MGAKPKSKDHPPDLSSLCPGITEHAPLPMAAVEGATHIVRNANPAFCRLLDRPMEQLIGKPFGELLPENDECVALLDRVFRTGKSESHTESQPSLSHPVFWSYTMWPVMADERAVGVMIQVTETTQFHETTLAMNEALMLGSVRQHELTAAAEKLNAQLQVEISERYALEAALAARASDLARTDRSKDEFLGMLAHELRNPLAALGNATEILRTTGVGADTREQAQHIVTRQIENMSRMIDDLLVSRITQGKIELRQQVVRLETILHAAANLARPVLEVRGQELAIALPPEPVFLNADATRLEQVFGNLLINACKYSGSGAHISLSAECAAAAKREPEVIVRVRDDGIGIAPEVLPYIFDLFVQATRAPDRTQGGLGIGLTLVQQLVKLHGGSVEAHSAGLGHGSEFIVHLPMLPGPDAAAPPPPIPTIPAREIPRRMLIVDDNEDSARSMAMLQRLRGHETRTAFTGPDAIAAAAEFAPEVVLLDIGLPGMDGYEVAHRLRAMPALTGSFIVAISGYGSPEDLAHARAAGFDEHLVKPADLDLLREWLRNRD